MREAIEASAEADLGSLGSRIGRNTNYQFVMNVASGACGIVEGVGIKMQNPGVTVGAVALGLICYGCARTYSKWVKRDRKEFDKRSEFYSRILEERVL